MTVTPPLAVAVRTSPDLRAQKRDRQRIEGGVFAIGNRGRADRRRPGGGVVFVNRLLKPKFATHRFPPDTAMPYGKLNPETSAALTAAPVVALYSPIVPLPLFMTHRSPPDKAMPLGLFNPATSEALTAAPVVALYSPIVPPPRFATHRFASRHSDAPRLTQPETSEALTTAPVVALYSPIVPVNSVRDP